MLYLPRQVDDDFNKSLNEDLCELIVCTIAISVLLRGPRVPPTASDTSYLVPKNVILRLPAGQMMTPTHNFK